MKSTITIYRLPWNPSNMDNREEWYAERVLGLTYISELEGEAAAEEAFHLTNAPSECLTEAQQEMLKLIEFKGPSLSVGDVVRVEKHPMVRTSPAEYYLCKSYGWEKYEGDVINLIKCMSWDI